MNEHTTASSSTARVATDRPERYAKQLASHFSRKIPTSWDPDAGRGECIFPDPDGGPETTCELRAEPGVLVMQVRGPQASVERVQGVMQRHLERFGERDALEVSWSETD